MPLSRHDELAHGSLLGLVQRGRLDLVPLNAAPIAPPSLASLSIEHKPAIKLSGIDVQLESAGGLITRRGRVPLVKESEANGDDEGIF